MLIIVVALAACLAAQVALSAEPASTDEKPKSDATSEKADAAAVTAAAAQKDEAFTPPPGFKTRKRGDEVLYCQRDATVGTRFKTEKCYNEEQLRTYMMVTEAQRRDLDRIRTNCGGGPCTPYEPPTPNR